MLRQAVFDCIPRIKYKNEGINVITIVTESPKRVKSLLIESTAIKFNWMKLTNYEAEHIVNFT